MKEVTIVKEFTDKRTATSREYLLSDGQHRIVQTLAANMPTTRSATVINGLEIEHFNNMLYNDLIYTDNNDPLDSYYFYNNGDTVFIPYIKAKLKSNIEGISSVRLKYKILEMTNENEQFGIFKDGENFGTYLSDADLVTENGEKYAEFNIWEDLKDYPTAEHVYFFYFKNIQSMLRVTLAGVRSNTPPQVIIDYAVAEPGVDYKQSYLEGEAGNAGAYKVNTRTGRLDFTKELFSLGGERMPMSMSMTYNPYISGGNYDTKMPAGWKLNYQQYVYADGANYAYIDGNYRKHTFEPLAGTDKYYDTAHTGLLLTVSGNTVTISDERTNTLTFASGILKYIVAQNGSTPTQTEITYSGSAMTIKDGMDRTATVTFGSDSVTVTRPDGNSIVLTVTDGKLTGVKEVEYDTGKHEQHSYEYESNGYLKNAAAGFGRKVEFAYNGATKVRQIDESVNDNATKRYVLSYRTGSTSVDMTKYPAANTGVTMSYVYAFAENGEATGTYEIKNNLVSDIRFRSQEDFARYTLYASGEESSKVLISHYPIMDSDVGESMAITPNTDYSLVLQGVVTDKEDRVLTILVTPDVSASSDNTCEINLNFYNSMGDVVAKASRTVYRDGGVQTFVFRVPNAVYTQHIPEVGFKATKGVSITVSEMRTCKRTGTAEYDCVNFGPDNSFVYKEYIGGALKNWYGVYECRVGQDSAVVKMSKNDWLLTMENMARANGGDFILWHSDVSTAMIVSPSTVIEMGSGSITESLPLSEIEYAKVSVNGTRTQFEYNAYDRVGSALAGSGSYAGSNCYASNGASIVTMQVTKNIVFEDNTNKVCYLRYDNYYRLKESEDSEGAVTEYTYDAYGNVTQEKITADGKSIVRNSEYGEADGTGTSGKYLVREKDYLIGITNTRAYKYKDGTGETVQETSPEGSVTEFTYKADGNPDSISALVTMDDGDQNNVNSFIYDDKGRLEKIRHNGFVYKLDYNEFDEVSSVKAVHYDGNNTADATYDLLNKTYTRTADKDTVRTYYSNDTMSLYYSSENEYDAYGRKITGDMRVRGSLLAEEKNIYGAVTDEITDDTTPTSSNLTINADSKLRKRIDNGRVSLYNYDNKGNVKKVIRKNGTTSSAETIATSETDYDAENRVTSRKDTVFGKAASATFSYENGDALNDDRIATCDVKYNSTGIDFDDSTSDVYDKFGRLKFRTRGVTYNLTPLFDEVYSYEYFEGPFSSRTTDYLKKVTCTYFDNSTTSYQYYYDKNGNITSVTYDHESTTPGEWKIASTFYTYDKLNRLTIEDDDGHFRRYAYTYDEGGNVRTKKEYPFSQGSVGNLQKTTVYEYDNKWKDRLTKITETDVNGNVTVKTINYDNRGKPVSYKGNLLDWRFDHLLSYGGITFDYGCDNVRQKKTANGTTTTYCYDGSRLLGERRVTGSTTVNIQYLYDHTGVIGFLMNDVRYKYAKNPQGDIVSVSGNNNIGTYRYDAWGKCTIERNDNGIADINPFRYRGYYYDTETNLYYLINRYYDPEIGRFISPDHIGYMVMQMGDINGCNLYAYCGNNPVMNTDPEGNVLPEAAAITVFVFIWFFIAFITLADTIVKSSSNIFTPNMQISVSEDQNNKKEITKIENDVLSFDISLMGKSKGKHPVNPNRRKGADRRQPTGQRERNVGHPKGEEHSRVPKGNRPTRYAILNDDILNMSQKTENLYYYLKLLLSCLLY